MKRIFFFIGLLLSFSILSAQKKVIQKQSASGINYVDIHVKFAENIEIKNWDKNEIVVEALANLNDNNDNHYFSLKKSKIGTTFTVKSDYGNFFEKHKKEITITSKEGNINSHKYYNEHNKVTVNYVIYVPQNMRLKVKSISGSVNAQTYKGDLTLDLISGDITVKKHSEKMNLKTISGDIDMYVSDAEFKAETLTGSVYSNLDIDFEKNSKKHQMGSKIHGTVKNGLAFLRLKTISGNIFLRK